MLTKDNSKETTKVLQDRYKQVLGEDIGDISTPAINNKKPVNRIIWLLISLSLVFGVIFIFKTIANTDKKDKTISSSINQSQQQKRTIADLKSKKETKKGTIPSKDIVVAATQDIYENIVIETETKIIHKADNFSTPIEIEQPSLPTEKELNIKPNEARDFLVIVASTQSKNDAISHAKVLWSKGYSSEVILSSSGYYGVVLGHFTFEDANKAVEKAVISENFESKPYIMDSERVEKYIDILNK